MRLHLATWPPEKQEEQTLGQAFALDAHRKEGMKLRILLSYWYYKDTDLDALFAKYFTPPYPDVFADSGAFSAMTQGANITCKDYADWVKRWKHLFCVYANLDVIRNGQKTWENQQTLEDMGIEPIPAFHVAEDFIWLERYVDKYPYIALGVAGMQRLKKQLFAWIIKCYEIAGKQSVFHGFALTSWDVMSSFPWYSVDSSSWGSGFRFGQVPLFDSRAGKFQEIRLGDRVSCRKHAALVDELGFDVMDFADRKRNDRAKICAISALSYMKAEQWLRRRWGEIYIPGRESAPTVLRAHLVTAQSNPDSERGSNMSINALGQAGLTGEAAVLRLHLADTSATMKNARGAESVIRLHLADARGPNGVDLAAAEAGLRMHLVDSPHTPLRDTGMADAGIRLHLAEHSLDRGGVGDTSRAMEILNHDD